MKPPFPIGTYVKRYPLFVPVARAVSIRQAEVDAGTAGGTQFATVPPSLRDGKSPENPTVYVVE